MIFERTSYLQRLIKAQGNGMIKIVTGIRRCGKSFLLFNIFRQYLIQHGIDEQHIVCLSMDDMRNEELRNPKRLLEYLDTHIINDGIKTFVIIDEVQFVKNFVDVLLSLTHMPNVEAYVSGSNSRFLSSDVVTEFRGRGWEIRIHPLSFAEYYEALGGDISNAYLTYLRYGGLPQVALIEDIESKKNFLQSIFETTYLRDVIERNHLRNSDGMKELIRILASAIGASTNPSRISKTFKSVAQMDIKSETINAYINHLQDAFIVNEALRYDVKGRKYIGTETKYYFEDLGIRNMLLNYRQEDEKSHLMENAIYNELRRRGATVDVGMVEMWEKDSQGQTVRKQTEIDFVVNKMPQKIYIQSALELSSRAQTAQEQRPLVNVNDNFKKVIIVGEQCLPWINEDGVQIISVYDFLMGNDDIV